MTGNDLAFCLWFYESIIMNNPIMALYQQVNEEQEADIFACSIKTEQIVCTNLWINER